ncbi:MAG: hypothetical protein A3F54_05205 [Candidatus Kerfeldbacteria bacterium RIFCSPHIGHO2_12_FULL_48_17]|uniref:NAD-dependent epimerase/dehydratase domain-containing protein n=1 Tax=Candidatus Kerfeldbacteria bacterium RIFCSPHIGHO2_12_FULL_48_17 TaxID=1798542 RepID=A0A1G2B533_9BACT|nr:MAG: hypothetical protein A3F54_05205 [Candidatus Kerfeldbacteria bacterium RIFCSPHIGHO2_12_FULL_48_17]
MAKRAIFDKKNVLVVGGAGFIGSHLCTELVKTSKVICVDNFSTGQEANVDDLLANPNFRFIRHDMSQPLDLLQQASLEPFRVQFQGIQEIYNFACPTSEKDPEKFALQTLLANSYVVKNILDIAVTSGAKVVHISTSAVYGDPLENQKVFPESYWGFVNPIGLRAPYNEGKRFAEAMVATYRKKYGLDFKIARLFHVYGPHMSFASGFTIPDMIKAAAGGEDVVIHGTGNEQRYYCYVSDVVDALLKLMQSNLSGPVNIGSTEGTTTRVVAGLITKALNSTSKVLFADPLPDYIEHAIPDITLAREHLSWFPVVRLPQGIQRTVKEMVASQVLRYTDFTQK